MIFIAIIVIISVVVLFGLFMSKKNNLIKENLEAALENQKHLHELELKALRGQMNPHFIHNSLNAIQYYVQRNDVETSEYYLTKFSKLMRLFFDYSNKQHLTIKEEILLLENYLQIEKLRFEEKLDYSIEVEKSLDIEENEIPSMILQPLVENAINHGLFHKKGKGKVCILFKNIGNTGFKVQVIDNGIGIKKSLERNKSLAKNKHSSTVIEERLFLLNESNNWNVNYEIIDRLLIENTNGTKVTLTFNKVN